MARGPTVLWHPLLPVLGVLQGLHLRVDKVAVSVAFFHELLSAFSVVAALGGGRRNSQDVYFLETAANIYLMLGIILIISVK